MTPIEAARLLEVSPDATPEQMEAQFLELRRKLEDRIAKAPTPGLQAKYRASLATITTAFESLMLASDASLLPVLQRADAPLTAAAQPASTAAPSAVHSSAPGSAGIPAPRPPKASRSRNGFEFVVVVLLAVVLLGAGGWWVVKQRAEKAEQARVAAEAAAELKRQQDEAAAELKRQQEAAAEEAARLARQATALRRDLATTRVEWEAYELQLRDAEKRLAELKSELRGFRDGPAWRKAELSALSQRYEYFTTWLAEYLVRHPVRIAQAQAEQLLQDDAVAEAAVAVEEMKLALQEADEYIRDRREYMLEGTCEVQVESQPSGIKFVFTDPYGRTVEGVTPAKLLAQPLSHLHNPRWDGFAGDTADKMGEFTVEPSVRYLRPGWKDVVETGRTEVGGSYYATRYDEGALKVESLPSGIDFQVTNAHGWQASGRTPATIAPAPPGDVVVTLKRPGYRDVTGQAKVEAKKTAAVRLDQRAQHVRITIEEPETEIWVNGKVTGRKEVTLTDLPPGRHQLELRHPKYPRYRANFDTRQEFTLYSLKYSFAQLASLTHVCGDCSGRGQFESSSRCGDCSGRGNLRCSPCKGSGYITWDMLGKLPCSYCKGTGRDECFSCSGSGKLYSYRTCARCSGLGRLSSLQLSQ